MTAPLRSTACAHPRTIEVEVTTPLLLLAPALPPVATARGPVDIVPAPPGARPAGAAHVLIARSGPVKVPHRGVQHTLHRGDLLVTAAPGPADPPHWDRLPISWFRFPAFWLGASVSELTRGSTIVVDVERSYLGRLTGSLLLASDSGDLPAAERHSVLGGGRLGRIAGDMLSSLIDEQAGHREREYDLRRGQVARVRAHIEERLPDPGLCARSVAHALGMSPRHLHRLFEAEELSVARLIRRRRLEVCRAELLRARGRVTVASVAQRWGFASATHFSRVFREAFGMSPRQWQHQNADPALSADGNAETSSVAGQS
ncbi:helix-turn-helix domain-containing protein [Streptomyces sp. NPDC001493]